MFENKELESVNNETPVKGKNAKKIAGSVLASVLFVSSLVGASFGYYKTYNNVGGFDTNYNDFIQIEADVKFDAHSGTNVHDAAKSLTRTLDFLGLQNSTVRTAGDSKVIINNPIESYGNDQLYLFSDKDSLIDYHFDPIIGTHESYSKEIASMIIPLFFDGTLDLRDEEGDAAFLKVSDDTDYTNYEFAGGVGNTNGKEGDFGVETDTGTETESYDGAQSRTIAGYDPADYYVKDFLGDASLKHVQGNPVIELNIAKEGNNGDGYINMYKELDAYIDDMNALGTPVTYVFWFNYELTYDLVEAMDSEGLTSAGSLYSYVSANDSLRPLYVTSSTESLMSSKYADTIQLNGTYSESQAKFFVDRINNSNSFEYSNVQFNVVFNLQTKIMLFVLLVIVLLIILVIIFAFVAYFGLLGLIAAAVFVLVTMISGLMYTSTGILLTGLGVLSLGVIAVISAAVIAWVLIIYKKDNEDKFLSVNKVASDKFKKIHGLLFSPMVTTVLLFYGAGLVIPTMIAVPLYLIVIGLVISYIFATIILFGIIYVMDLLTNWSRVEINKKWDWAIGKNLDFDQEQVSVNVSSEVEAKTSKWGVIAAVIAMLVAVVMGGVMYGTTGSPFNTNSYGATSYSYVVQAKDLDAILYLNEGEDVPNDKYGYEHLQSYYEETDSKIGDVKNVFKDNGVKVSNIETIRLDEINDNGDLVATYGYEIQSRTAIDNEKVDALNEDLTSVIVDLQPEEEVITKTTTFEMAERLSWTGHESVKIIGFTQNLFFVKALFGLILMSLITALILLFVGNWGVAIAALVSTMTESLLLVTPLVILFLPISTLVAFPILILAGISFRTKVVIAKQAKEAEVESNKWQKAAKSQSNIVALFAGVLIIFELLLIGTFSFVTVLPMIIVTLIAPFAVYLVQNFVYVSLASKLSDVRDNNAKAKLQKDIEESKSLDKSKISEEYIDGVNM